MCQINQLLAEIRNLKNLPISPRNWLKSSLISLKKSPVFNCIMGLTPSEKAKRGTSFGMDGVGSGLPVRSRASLHNTRLKILRENAMITDWILIGSRL